MTQGFQERPPSEVDMIHRIHRPSIVWGSWQRLGKIWQNPALHIERSKEVNGGVHARQCIITIPVLVLHSIERISYEHVGEIERLHNRLQYHSGSRNGNSSS